MYRLRMPLGIVGCINRYSIRFYSHCVENVYRMLVENELMNKVFYLMNFQYINAATTIN